MILIKYTRRIDSLFMALLMSGMLLSATAGAADEVTTRALKLYEKHHYEEATHLLRPELINMDGARQAAASLALGMIHLSNGRLNRELQQTALAIELDYLKQLGKQKTGKASRYVNLYLGQVLMEAGKPADAATYLQRFISRIDAKSPLKSYAEIELGIVFSRQKKQQNALKLWGGQDARKPELKAALAGAYAAAGLQNKKPVAMADAALMEAQKQHYIPSPRMVRNLLRAYSQSGATEKALALLGANDMKEASHVENLGRDTSISFYDSSVFGDMAKTHIDAAVKYLEQAKTDPKLSSSANYYLVDAYLQQGNATASLRAASEFLAQTQNPALYNNMTRIHQAAALYIAGKRDEAAASWLSLAETSSQDPVLLAEIVQSCTEARADCVKMEKIAVSAADKGDGKKYFPLNAALGKYYLSQKDYPKAVTYMEAGRDKAYKNKIEVNDPAMLTALAEAYYRNKKFSESLEIYFEIGKEYPAVRQIQEAMQGIYAMEHRSAGDVKIF